MTKTIHPMMSHYSSKKRGGAYFKFRPIGGALIRGGNSQTGVIIIPSRGSIHTLALLGAFESEMITIKIILKPFRE